MRKTKLVLFGIILATFSSGAAYAAEKFKVITTY